MAILIRGGRVLTHSQGHEFVENCDILIEGSLITKIGANLEQGIGKGTEIIEAREYLVMPGFVDAHMHSNEGFEMGRYDNLPLEIWLSEVYPPFNSPALSWREHYLRAMLVAIVSIKSGVTSLQDDVINLRFTPDAVDATASAYRDIGLRGWITASMWDQSYRQGLPHFETVRNPELEAKLDALRVPSAQEQIDLFHDLRKTWHGRDGIRIILGPCGPQRCSDELMQKVAALSEELNLPIHCHVLETKVQAVTGRTKYGSTLVRHLKDIGALTHRLTLNHAIWLTDDDIEMMGGAGCSITHNPLANLKLGSGISPIRKLKRAGVNVALGCDGVASSDTADMFQAIRAASLIHKIGTYDYQEWVSAHEVFEMATSNGAKSSLMEREVGSIEVGKQADIVLMHRKEWGFLPLHDPIQQISFSASSEAVKTVIIAGKIVMRDRRLLCIDEEEFRMEISEAAEKFRRDYCPAMAEGAAMVRPWLDAVYDAAWQEDINLGESPRRLSPSDVRRNIR